MTLSDNIVKVHQFFSQGALLAILGLVAIVWSIGSLILVYHWNNYALEKRDVIVLEIIYFIGSFLILTLAVSGVITY